MTKFHTGPWKRAISSRLHDSRENDANGGEEQAPLDPQIGRRELLQIGGSFALAASAGCATTSSDSSNSSSEGEREEARTEHLPWQRDISPAPTSLLAGPRERRLLWTGRIGEPLVGVDLTGKERWRRTDDSGDVIGASGSHVLLRWIQDHDLAAIDPATGGTDWTLTMPGSFETPISVGSLDGTVYVVGEQRGSGETNPPSFFTRLYALEADTGNALWERELPFVREWEWRIETVRNRIVALIGDGELRCYGADGSLQWRRSIDAEVETPQRIVDDPRFEFSGVYRVEETLFVGANRLYGEPPRRILALDITTGETRWQSGKYDHVLGADQERVYCGRSDRPIVHRGSHESDRSSDGSAATAPAVAALDPATGDERWRGDPGAVVGFDGARARDVLYVTVAAPADELRAIDRATGETLDRYSLTGERITSPVVADDGVFVASGTYRDAPDGEVVRNGGRLHGLRGIHAGSNWPSTDESREEASTTTTG